VTTQLGPSGDTLLDELQWVHRMVRRDLQTCRDLAAAVTTGAPTAEIRSQIHSLQTSGPLFQLRVSCLRYCHFVHAHHGAEDVMLFPAVRQAAPELGPVVDRLESDHRRVSDLLDQVEASVRELDGADDRVAREGLAGALNQLAVDLLEHLQFEETALAPVLAGWTHW
jgi:iron-sulfur cluster repair protein YtfE (RIC family)